MAFYIECFFATLIFSTIFAVGGLGSAIVLIPVLSFLGVGFSLAKAVGLFVNTVTTSTASYLNLKRGALDVKFVAPFLIFSVATAPLGTMASHMIDVRYVKMMFVCFLFFSVYMMFKKKQDKPKEYGQKSPVIFYPLGGVVGFMAGLLGIGGGALIVPVLFHMGLETKKIAVITSFMIPFATLSAFASYAYTTEIDWMLILVTTVAAIIGGFIGNRIMHLKAKSQHIKIFLSLVLLSAALKMIYDLL